MNKPRLLAPSRVMRATPAQPGGGWDRDRLVAKARDAIRMGSRSFALSSMLFDPLTRERVWLLYAWCRRCDDIVDNQEMGGALGDQKDRQDRLEAIRVLTRRAFEGQPTADPAFDGFGLVAAECGITPEMAEDVIAGFALDASDWQPRTDGDMMRYCYHVAGAVGVMMAVVMGIHPDESEMLDRACDLGLAFQLANISRDVVEDAAAGRCYIPDQWLVERDLEPGEHARPHNRFVLASIMPRMVARMDRHIAASRLGARRLRFRQRWAILSAARIYGAIGHKVLDRGQNAWNNRVVVGPMAKFGYVAAALIEAIRNNPEPPEPMPAWSRSLVQPVRGW